MAHLKMYVNGTPGLADGVEVNASNLIQLMENSVNYIYLRCDPGYRATGVIVTPLNNCVVFGPYNYTTADARDTDSYPVYAANFYSQNVGAVDQLNIGLRVWVTTTPDGANGFMSISYTEVVL